MAVADDLPQLECGRTTEQVWAGIDRPPDEHERSCEHCLRARTDLQRLQEAVASERRLTQDATDQPGDRVKSAIMDIARNEIRQGQRIPLERVATGEPELAITERALIELVLFAADSVDAVRARRVRISRTDDPALIAPDGPEESAAGAIAVTMTVSIAVAGSIPDTVATLRDLIIDTVAERVGLDVDRIDITVEDVHDD